MDILLSHAYNCGAVLTKALSNSGYTYHHIISFILSWGMNIPNNITQATS
jgi:hypothetical protein